MFLTIDNTIKTLIIWHPLEYCLHYFLHLVNEKRHKEHHILVHKNNLQNFNSVYDLEYFYYILPVLYYFNYPILFLGSLWYFTVHTIIHFKPELLPNLSKHHMEHHIIPNCNFGITTTFLDKINRK